MPKWNYIQVSFRRVRTQFSIDIAQISLKPILCSSDKMSILVNLSKYVQETNTSERSYPQKSEKFASPHVWKVSEISKKILEPFGTKSLTSKSNLFHFVYTKIYNRKIRQMLYDFQNKPFQFPRTLHTHIHKHTLEVKRCDRLSLISTHSDNCGHEFYWERVEFLNWKDLRNAREFLEL